MNLELINPFITSASNVITTMATMEIKQGEALQCTDLPPADITGILTMVSDRVEGVLAVSFTKPVIFELTKRLLGIEPTDIDEIVEDMVGDITNMVYGSAKTILDEEGYNFDMVIPDVIQEADIAIDFPRDSMIAAVTFETEAGEFHVLISFEGGALQ
ncbi:MAG TPA: chemotaxis protein CheX [Thiotrichaceae bacterium]|jgi:chemotaxis protein CheX|nr:chemotaxis protein CheX [Thiotrichaceae bacterium]HIM09138.1 chemotaxis protein CheX [Gammaproteobacteria bacterium]